MKNSDVNFGGSQSYGLKEDEIKHRLDTAKKKKVQFSLKTNISVDAKMFNIGSEFLKYIAKFEAKEFIHIMESYNVDWWIGRIVKDGCKLKLIPSAHNIESVRRAQLKKIISNKSKDDHGPVVGACTSDPSNSFNLTSTEKTKKLFFKRQELVNPYEMVPIMRPVIICGPSLKGFPVTDMMQKAIFDFIKFHFKGRVSILHIAINIFNKKNLDSSKSGISYTAEKTAELKSEIERINNVAKSMNLIVLDAEHINFPNQVKTSTLAPIVVGLRVKTAKVFKRLLMSYSKSQRRSMQSQIAAAQKLSEFKQDMFDVLLEESELSAACEHLAEYLEAYYNAVHSPLSSDEDTKPCFEEKATV